MNRYFKQFMRRGLVFGGFGPIVMGIIHLTHYLIVGNYFVSGKQIFCEIISIYVLAFIQAGASVFNQIEEWSVLKCTTVHFLTLYLAYVICYVSNTFMPFKIEVILMFTLIFAVVYFAVWSVVVISIKCVSRKMNKRLADMEQKNYKKV